MVHGTHNAIADERNDNILIYVNGDLVRRNEASISVFDSGYLIGDGIWEALRLHEGVLVFLDEHLDRLWQAAAAVAMDLGMSREDLTAELWRTLDANKMHDNVHVRFMLTRGIKKTPSQDPRLVVSGPNLVIIAEHKLASPESKENGVTLFTSTIRRGSPDYLDPRLNCHSKLHEVLALLQAIEAGADEALMLDNHGFVATCNATNFFMVKGSEVWTSTGQYCMNGITRAKVIEDVYGADEAFVTGTFGGLTPVTAVDGRTIGEGVFGPMTRRLEALYQDKIKTAVLAARKAS
jgi:branched-chain amino acid aminotransferase